MRLQTGACKKWELLADRQKHSQSICLYTCTYIIHVCRCLREFLRRISVEYVPGEIALSRVCLLLVIYNCCCAFFSADFENAKQLNILLFFNLSTLDTPQLTVLSAKEKKNEIKKNNKGAPIPHPCRNALSRR